MLPGQMQHGSGSLRGNPSLHSLWALHGTLLRSPSPALGCGLQGADAGAGGGHSLRSRARSRPVSCPLARALAFFTLFV